MSAASVKSIRRYLLASLIIALTAGALLVVIFTYFNAAEEIDELYDKNMMELAETIKSQISALNLKEYNVKNTVGPSLQTSIKEEQEFLVQVWGQDRVPVYTSHRAIAFPFQEKRGARTTTFQDKAWHTYGTATDDFVIQVSQPQKARNRYVREISLTLLYPLLLLIPVVGFFIWLAVGRSLTPLNDISSAITKRSAISLDPLSENVPLEVKPLVQELNALLVRLNISLQAQRSFTADAAHQLRTPLTALQLQLGNLKRAKTDLERERYAAQLQDGMDRATHVVQQLLTLARVEPNRMEAQKQPVDLALIAREAVTQYAEMAIEKNIDLGMQRCERTVVSGSAENLRTLLENLVGNALRYTPHGGKVNVCVYEHNGRAVLKVQDNGMGIPAAERTRIFERFYRVLGTDAEGTGLGLAIAQSIVEQHAGAITVADGIGGKGASFTVTLPTTAANGIIS